MKCLDFFYTATGIVCLALASQCAYGNEVSLSGFGTIGAAHSDTDLADFIATTIQPNGVGRSRQTSLGLDSRLGAQFDWTPTTEIAFVGQIIAKQDYANRWKPQLSLAFMQFEVSPGIEVRAGALRPPVFLLSDFIDVNYSNPWVRPPVEFYIGTPITKLNGVDLIARSNIGDAILTVQPYFGSSHFNLPGDDIRVSADRMKGIGLSLQKGNMSYRLGYLDTRLTVRVPFFDQVIFPGLEAACTAGDGSACTQYSKLIPRNKGSHFLAVGVRFDDQKLFLISELGRLQPDSAISDGAMGYLSGGVRYGNWTPYATYAYYKNESPTLVNNGSPPVNAIGTLLRRYNLMDQTTSTLGLRYDITTGLALKSQWDRVRTDTNKGEPGTGVGTFNRIDADPQFSNRSNTVNILSISVDFIF